jgi:hypothetical protein
MSNASASAPARSCDRGATIALLAAYPIFVTWVVIAG